MKKLTVGLSRIDSVFCSNQQGFPILSVISSSSRVCFDSVQNDVNTNTNTNNNNNNNNNNNTNNNNNNVMIIFIIEQGSLLKRLSKDP